MSLNPWLEFLFFLKYYVNLLALKVTVSGSVLKTTTRGDFGLMYSYYAGQTFCLERVCFKFSCLLMLSCVNYALSFTLKIIVSWKSKHVSSCNYSTDKYFLCFFLSKVQRFTKIITFKNAGIGCAIFFQVTVMRRYHF